MKYIVGWCGAVVFCLLGVRFTLAQANSRAPVLTVLHNFNGADGQQVQAGLVRDDAGNLYGTTVTGGRYNFGVVFKLDAVGKLTVVHHFTGGADGGYPQAGLIRDAAGNFYGTASWGGTGSCFQGECGVVFKLDPRGKETVLYSFFRGKDGAKPVAGLLRDEAGNLYGTAAEAGLAGGCGGAGCGVVFKLDPTGKQTVLYSFTGGTDGGQPLGELMRDASGNLYGTTLAGGIRGTCGPAGCGVVFRVDPTGHESVPYHFQGEQDGAGPIDGLISDGHGHAYSTATYRGGSDWGVIFRLNAAGKETVLHSFTGGADGATPEGALLLDAAGGLYGTAMQGGMSCSCGVIFNVRPDGKFIILHQFNGLDGFSPYGDLVRDGAGNLYGTTAYGGTYGLGVVFKLSP